MRAGSKDSRTGRRLGWLLLVLVLALAMRQWVWMPTVITGESMHPTLRAGQFAGINKLAYRFGPPRHGEIVVVRTEAGLAIKRILGLPGEEVAFRGGVLYVNGSPWVESYARLDGGRTIAPGRLGADRFVVAGDNRPDSFIAVVNRERIVGWLVLWR